MLAWFSANMMFRGRLSPMEHPKFNPCQAVARQPMYCQCKHAVPRPGNFWSPGDQIIMDSHITTNNIYIAQHKLDYNWHIKLLQYLTNLALEIFSTCFTDMCKFDSHSMSVLILVTLSSPEWAQKGSLMYTIVV